MIVIIKQVNWTEKNLNWIFDFGAGNGFHASPLYHALRLTTGSWCVICGIGWMLAFQLCAHGLIWAIVHYIIQLFFIFNFANVHRWNINILIMLLSFHLSLIPLVCARIFCIFSVYVSERMPFGTLLLLTLDNNRQHPFTYREWENGRNREKEYIRRNCAKNYE